MTEHTPTPWSLCSAGECSCLTIYCPDFPIAKVKSGEWGDDYPAMRRIGGSLSNKYEAYMEQITYGEISPNLARANASFIVKAVNNHDPLVNLLEKVHRWFEMANDGEEGSHYMNGDSDKYPGNGYADGDALQIELRDALAAVGGSREP